MQRNQKRCFLLPQFVIQWVGVLVVAFAAFGAHAAPKAVRVVSDNNYPPYLFLGPDGQPRGYIVDLWKLWEKKTGIHVDLEPMQWSAAQAAMRGGNADVVDMIFDTPERDGLYRFSPPYSTQTVGIYVDHTIQGIRDPRSLRGFQVGVERGDACVDKLHHLGIDNLSLYPNYQAILAAAQSGAIKIFCMDDEPANYYLYLSRNQLRFAKAFTLYTDGFRWATRLGDDAMFALIMQGMKQIDGRERDALRRRWFTQPVQFLPYARLAAAVVLASLGALSALALWIWSLRRAVRSKTAALHDRNDALVRQACELVDEHARLRALIESSPDAMWLKERGGAYIDCNAKAAEFMGRAREEIIGHVIDELGNNDVLIAGIRQIDRRVWDTRSMQRGEFTIISPADVTCDIEIIKVPIFAPDGEITGVLGVARDITERRRAERELRIAAVAFESQDGIVISDARDLIQRVNTAFTELTGYCAEEIVGSNASSLLGS